MRTSLNTKEFPYGTVVMAVVAILLLFAAFMYLPDLISYFKAKKEEGASTNDGSSVAKKSYCTGLALDLNKILQKGTNANEVCVLQKVLNDWLKLEKSMNRNKEIASLVVDGIFGSKTENVVYLFKKQKSIRLNDIYMPDGFSKYNTL